MSEDTKAASGNQTRTPRDAAEYMDKLNGEIIRYPIEAAWAEMAKTRTGNKLSEDDIYAYVDHASGNGRFAVFDGAGGSNNPFEPDKQDARIAAQAARQELHDDAYHNGDTVIIDPSAHMERLFDSMAAKIAGETEKGFTTGIVAFVDHTDEGLMLEWGAVGDSLGFILRGDELIQLNKEETERQEMLDRGVEEARADKRGNIITNALGFGEFSGLDKTGRMLLQDGDVLILTSDGVTGDDASQRMRGGDNEAAIKEIMNRPKLSNRERAQLLLEHATKDDDRSALIVEIGRRRIPSRLQARALANQLLGTTVEIPAVTEILPPIAPRRHPQAPGRVGSTVLKHLKSRKSRA